MIVFHTAAELAAWTPGERRAAVFTMGALHEGHVELMRAARAALNGEGRVIVTIFVNPTQFNDPKDLERYPRTPEADLAMCEAAGVDAVFLPSVDEMYPPGSRVKQVSAGALGGVLEGASRPGHFDAVATVVRRLIEVTSADLTCFGEKDYQQLCVVREMIVEQQLACEVIAVPTVREADGLAKSSRNRLLGEADRVLAAELHRALRLVSQWLSAGTTSDFAVKCATAYLEQFEGIDLDYLVVKSTDLSELTGTGAARALIAARLGGIRLIDNLAVEVTAK